MNILFYGFGHDHVTTLYNRVKNNEKTNAIACLEEDAEIRARVEIEDIVWDENSYDYWLANKDVDVVAICGVYGNRGNAIIKALEAGKHVIADKPICITLKEYKKIKKLLKEKNLKLACLYDLRYTPAAKAAKKIFESGELGEVTNVSYTGQHCLGYDSRPSWYFKKGMHGGTLNDLSIHGIDLITHLTGNYITDVLSAKCWNAYADKHEDFKDCAMYMAELNNGGVVMADTSYSAPISVYGSDIYWNFKFWCKKGLLNFSFKNSFVTVYKMGADKPEIVEGIVDDANWLDDFILEIENDTSTFTDSVLKSTEIALTIQKYADKH